ncbi:VOC family protein [Pseudoroseomonas cervicalis]|uniref:VOC family protein n=1 Tax=Teichococcus cervicalis TaxID=204525 RepID=UPI0022F1CAAC|nr:VOC family protein [Pseudoroseomonas cervicalis]WBV43273.1 VOC family protein [Pseudoroseomonas cervicalis]
MSDTRLAPQDPAPPGFPDDALGAERPWAAPLHPVAVALAARDAAGLARWYERLLGLPARQAGAAEWRVGGLLRLRAAPQARPQRGDEPGLFHTAFLLPSRAALAGWLRHAAALGVALEGASDHGVSDALYLSDPEGNGIEVYVDRPRAAWPRPEAGGPGVAMVTRRLDLQALLAEAPQAALPPAVRIGHVHLRGGDVPATAAFYEGLGLAEMQAWPRASFLASGGYHHHLAVNAWHSAGQRPEGLLGLDHVVLAARDAAARQRAAAGLAAPAETAEGLLGRDPSGNGVLLLRG